MLKQLKSLAFAALAALSAATPVHAFPDRMTFAELLKVDLPGLLPPTDISVVVMMPESCFGVEKTFICKQFRQFKPGAFDKYSYAVAEPSVPKLKSISAQVAALPEALRQRRYVVLTDWTMGTKPARTSFDVYLNGEVVVYDQQQRKVLWHSIALSSTGAEEKHLVHAVQLYLHSTAGEAIHYGRMLDYASAKGIGVRSLASGAQGDAGYNLLVFNSRSGYASILSDTTASINIEPGPEDTPFAPLASSMPEGTYVALRLPPGKYRLKHDHRLETEVNIDAQLPKVVELTTRGYSDHQVDEVTPKRMATLSASMRNLLLPDPTARAHYTGALAWSDTEPGAEPAMPAAAAAAPVRAARTTARMRFYGHRRGHKMEFYQPSMCYRGSAKGTDVLMGEGGLLGPLTDTWKSISIGMPEHPETIAIKAKPQPHAFYREFEIAADQPLTIAMSDGWTAGNQKTTCVASASMMPQAGADYEARFVMTNQACAIIVKEISVTDSVLSEHRVELARASVCK